MKSDILTDKVPLMAIFVYLFIFCYNSLHLLSTFRGPFNLSNTPQRIFKACFYSEFSILELQILPLSHSQLFTLWVFAPVVASASIAYSSV